MREIGIRAFCSTLLVFLCGCTAFNGVINGEPNFDPNILLPPEVALSLYTAFPKEFSVRIAVPPTCYTAFNNPAPAGVVTPAGPPSRYNRDICINELMTMVDVQYDEYKKSFRQLADDSNLAADIAVIGLGSAGALVPAKTAKAILSGTAAAITGAKAAIDSDVFYNSSILVVINQMDTDRQNQRCLIAQRMKNDIPSVNPPPVPTALTTTTVTQVAAANTNKPIVKPSTTTSNVSPAPPATYSMYDASADLVAYYQAGTFTHALQSLQAKTGAQAVTAKQQANDQKTGNNSSATPAAGGSAPSSPNGAAASPPNNSAASGQCSS